MSQIQHNCKVDQAAQAQNEVFEAIQQSKNFYFLQLVEPSAGYLQCRQIGRNKKNKHSHMGKYKKTISNEIYSLAFKANCRKWQLARLSLKVLVCLGF